MARHINEKGRDMVAFLKSDLFMKFMGGFVLGTIGVLTLSPAEAQPRQAPAPVSAVFSDAF